MQPLRGLGGPGRQVRVLQAPKVTVDSMLLGLTRGCVVPSAPPGCRFRDSLAAITPVRWGRTERPVPSVSCGTCN